jgi:hypothetical protein
MGVLQTTDPRADNYVSAGTSGAADIELSAERKGSRRPFQRTLRIDVRNGGLGEGEEITLVLGDTAAGSRGWRQQTFVETPFPIRVAVDPFGTHLYRELPRDLGWDVVAGPVARYVLNVPSHAVVEETFTLRLKAEDAWGNPLRDLSEGVPQLALVKDGRRRPLEVPGEHDGGVWRFLLNFDEQGTYFFETTGGHLSVSNGVRVVATAGELPEFGFHWCDLHGQSGETVGAGTIRDYFSFGRHFGFLDGSVHQGNDFQITLPLWEDIKRASNEAYQPGTFVTFPGYEWSGTTAMGGDHNVIYFEEDPPIYRSSGWLDGHPFEETAPLEELYRELRAHNAMTIAHVGGRPAALTESDPEVEPLMEIHSAWGTFEWVYREAFARGFKIGFVCGSDGHKGRPGASYPGAGVFGTLGGLTCVLSKHRDRGGFWEALKRRRCYGTTGQRIVVETELNGYPPGAEVKAERARIGARVVGTSPLVAVELLRGTEVIRGVYPGAQGSPDVLLLRFGGAKVKGRARMVPWEGRVTVSGNTYAAFTMHGIYSPIYGITDQGERELGFSCVTTGNLVNLELAFRDGLTGRLAFASNVTHFERELDALDREPTTLFDAPLDQRVEALVLARESLPLELETEFEVEIDHTEEAPYFLRITQLDEGKAWTSPFFVARG